MNRQRFLIVIIILLVAINAISIFVLLPRGHKGMHDRPRNAVIERLNFDAKQVEAYDKLIDQHRRQTHQNDEEMRELRNQLYASVKTGDPEVANVLLNRLGDLQTKIETTHYQHFMDIKSLCTDEQLPKFNELSDDLAHLFKRPEMRHERPERK